MNKLLTIGQLVEADEAIANVWNDALEKGNNIASDIMNRTVLVDFENPFITSYLQRFFEPKIIGYTKDISGIKQFISVISPKLYEFWGAMYPKLFIYNLMYANTTQKLNQHVSIDVLGNQYVFSNAMGLQQNSTNNSDPYINLGSNIDRDAFIKPGNITGNVFIDQQVSDANLNQTQADTQNLNVEEAMRLLAEKTHELEIELNDKLNNLVRPYLMMVGGI